MKKNCVLKLRELHISKLLSCEAYSIVPYPTELPRAPLTGEGKVKKGKVVSVLN
jgi:hypothetical protein